MSSQEPHRQPSRRSQSVSQGGVWAFGLREASPAPPPSRSPLSSQWVTRTTRRDEVRRRAAQLRLKRLDDSVAIDNTRPDSQSSQWMVFNNTRLLPAHLEA